MTKHIDIAEAETDLLDLVDEVEGGTEVIITRHGKPVARLTPMRLATIREIGRHLDLGDTLDEIKAKIAEERR